MSQELHAHQGLVNVAHAHAPGDGVAQALVGGGCSRFQSAAQPQPRRAVIRLDPLKRLRTLEQRGLDFLDAERVFAGPKLEFEDRRRDYGEVRTVCLGLMEGRMVVIIYTQRSFFRQIMSMRKANSREQLRFRHHFS